MSIVSCESHWVKCVRIRSFSCPYFLASGLNTVDSTLPYSTGRQYSSVLKTVFSPNARKCGPENSKYGHVLRCAHCHENYVYFGKKMEILLRYSTPISNSHPIWHCVKSVQIRSYFWSVFSCIRIEYGDLLHKSPYWIRIQENKDQK